MNLLSNNETHLSVQHTYQWLEQVIVGLNFCPFAKKELVNNTIYYFCSEHKKIKRAAEEFAQQCQYLAENDNIQTSLIIYAQGFQNFESYLDLVELCNQLIVELGYEGIFQIATFHPQYCFEGEAFDDASNFTNRSPYPTLHLIREQSMAKVLAVYKEPEKIPHHNIALARAKGSDYFKQLLMAIMQR